MQKETTSIEVELTKSGFPTIGIGGGATASYGEYRFVLNARKQLKRALFIKHSGHLANSLSQAIVVLNEGDILIEGNCKRYDPKAAYEANELKYKAYKIISTKQGIPEIILEETDLKFEDIPEKVWDGAMSYHNRSALYFCEPPKEKQK